jgi:hypothetical protein
MIDQAYRLGKVKKALENPVARGMILSVDLRFNDFSRGLF